MTELSITPPILVRISIGKVVEKNGKRLPEKDDQFSITSQVQNKERVTFRPVSTKDKLPRGLGGSFWAKRKHQYGEIYRPHRHDEIVVECCFPLWGKSASTKPYYVVVIASGPYGGIETVYINGQAFYYFGAESSEAIIPQWQSDLLTLLPQTLDIKLAIKHYGVTSYGGIA